MMLIGEPTKLTCQLQCWRLAMYDMGGGAEVKEKCVRPMREAVKGCLTGTGMIKIIVYFSLISRPSSINNDTPPSN